MRSYAIDLQEANSQADGSLLGVRLGRLSIRTKTPVAVIAKQCRVSRVTVYNWFVGTYSPKYKNQIMVQRLISSMKEKLAASKAK
jgi:hypothetical protein